MNTHSSIVRAHSGIRKNNKKGFTLIEILVVIGIIAVLAAIVLVAVNPARQFKLARDTQRVSNINAILNAMHQNMAEHKGVFVCAGSPLTLATSPVVIKYAAAANDPGHLAPCLVPDYISALPFDPSSPIAKYVDENEYDTEYTYSVDTNGRITVTANGEIPPALINVTR